LLKNRSAAPPGFRLAPLAVKSLCLSAAEKRDYAGFRDFRQALCFNILTPDHPLAPRAFRLRKLPSNRFVRQQQRNEIMNA
jgi:hypothetical protein